MAKHDENKDLRLIGRIAKVNFADKTIQAPKTATIGIHMWGKIDFLRNYCGWHFIWKNDAIIVSAPSKTSNEANSKTNKKAKREAKQMLNVKAKKNAKSK